MAVSEVLNIVHVIDGVAFHLQRKVKWLLLRGEHDNAISGIQEDIKVLQDLIVDIKIHREWRKKSR